MTQPGPFEAKKCWQDEILLGEPFGRISGAAGLPILQRAPKDEIERALHRLANQCVHRSFERPLPTKRLKAVQTWAARSGAAAALRQEEAVRDIDGLGRYRPPPPWFESGRPFHRYVYNESNTSRQRGRPAHTGADDLLEKLLACHWLLFEREPLEVVESIAAFIRQFYVEVDDAICVYSIKDPQKRGRLPDWQVPELSTVEGRIRRYPHRRGWRHWEPLDCGEMVLTKHGQKARRPSPLPVGGPSCWVPNDHPIAMLRSVGSITG
jgi:hypothetical protein